MSFDVLSSAASESRKQLVLVWIDQLWSEWLLQTPDSALMPTVDGMVAVMQ